MRVSIHFGGVLVLVAGALLPLAAGQAQVISLVPRDRAGRYSPDRPLRTFAGRDGTWAWLQRTGYEAALFVQKPHGKALQIATGRDWDELAVDGDSVWILERGPRKGALLRLAMSPGAQPERVHECSNDHGALLVADGKVYWLEQETGRRGLPTYVPTVGPTLKLWTREPNASMRSLGNWPGSSEVSQVPGPGDLIGVAKGAVWARVRRQGSTEFVRFPFAGAAPERVAGSLGQQEGVLTRDGLYWTAPSPEAGANGVVSLRHLSSTGTELVADWLPADGNLLQAGEALYYTTKDRLFRIRSAGDLPRPLRAVHGGQVTSDGSSLVLMNVAVGPTALTVSQE